MFWGLFSILLFWNLRNLLYLISQAARVNQVVGQFQELVMGRIGVPDHARAMAVIGLLVRGGSVQVGAFAARLGNIPGVQVKSALTKERKEISHEKAD